MSVRPTTRRLRASALLTGAGPRDQVLEQQAAAAAKVHDDVVRPYDLVDRRRVDAARTGRGLQEDLVHA